MTDEIKTQTISANSTWQERVIAERDELADRLAKLQFFIGSIEAGSGEVTISPTAFRLLEAQEDAMQRYLEILEERIEAFEG